MTKLERTSDYQGHQIKLVVTLGHGVTSRPEESKLVGGAPVMRPHVKTLVTGYLDGVEFKKVETVFPMLEDVLNIMENEMAVIIQYEAKGYEQEESNELQKIGFKVLGEKSSITVE